MPEEMRRMADFLEIPVGEGRWEEIIEYCSFDWMKRNASKSVPLGGAFWDAGAQVFINRGTNGRWTETLTHEDVAAYEARAEQELGPECARWLATDEGGEGSSELGASARPRIALHGRGAGTRAD
jgi:aryl sulfotransferase